MSSAEADWANDRRYWLNKLKQGDKVFVYMEPNNGGERKIIAIVEDVRVFKSGEPRGEEYDYLRIDAVFVELQGHDYNGHPLIIDAVHSMMIMEYMEPTNA